MIDFELFTRLYSEAKQYDDIDLFTSERGWQDWMDNFSTQEVIFILNKNRKRLAPKVWETFGAWRLNERSSFLQEQIGPYYFRVLR